VTRNSVLPDSAARNGIVDIPDLTANTLNKFSDALPPDVARCDKCPWPSDLWGWCQREGCPIAEFRKSSNMRAAAVHPPNYGDGADGCREPEKLIS